MLNITSEKSTKSNSIMSKNGTQNLEFQRDHNVEIFANCSSNSLKKQQGKRWQQIFDFDNILKQIRTAEKLHLKGKSDSGNSKSNSSLEEFFSPKNVHLKNCRQIKQVLRLNGNDMHYYGIVPKTKAENVVVCNICMGIYTKIGFNNHMMLQHPTIWSSVSTKLNSENNDFQNISNKFQENCSDRDSKADLPGEIQSSLSNFNSTATTDMNILCVSENSTCPSTNKRNSNNSLCSNSYSTVDGLIDDSINNSTISTYTTPININLKDTTNPLSANSVAIERQFRNMPYCSSSNSSSSFPSTPKTISNFSDDLSTNKISELNIKVSHDHQPVSCSKNQMAKSPIYPESEFVESPKSNSSNDSGVMSVPNISLSKVAKDLLTKNTFKLNSGKKVCSSLKQKCVKKHQSVSQENEKLDSVVPTKKNIQNKHPYELLGLHSSHENSSNSKPQTNQKIVNNLQKISSDINPQNSEILISEKSMDENLLTLEDVLDTKFINEILSTTDSEINFEENELNSEIQQTYFPTPSKKMRFDKINRQQTYLTDVLTETTIYQENENQNNALYKYDIKMYNNGVLEKYDKNATIDAQNFQQMMYQPTQKLHHNNNIGDLNRNIENKISIKSKIGKTIIDNTHSNITTSISANTEYGENTFDVKANNFQILSIPSISDDITEELITPNFMKSIFIHQCTLSNVEGNNAIEIKPYNQLSFINQQKRQNDHDKFIEQKSHSTIDVTYNKLLNELSKVFSVDFICVDKTKTLSNFQNNVNSSSENVKNGVDTERSFSGVSKFNEEYFLNIFMYSGAPLPFIINNFGIVKFPQSITTTTRKNLLSRKANNNPITFNGGVNGIVGSSTTTTIFSNPNAKSATNFLSSISGSAINSMNDLSIGSIVISNPKVCSQHHNYILSKINACGQIEIVLNGPTNGHLIMPLQSNRNKGNGTIYNQSNINGNSSINSKNKINSHGGISNSYIPQNIPSDSTRVGSLPQDFKAISFCNKINSMSRMNIFKRNFITKQDISRKSNFSPKLLNEILGGTCKATTKKSYERIFSNFDSEPNQIKLGRITVFNDRRKKILVNTLREKFYQLKKKTNWQSSNKIVLTNQSFEYTVNNISRFKNSSNDSIRIIV